MHDLLTSEILSKKASKLYKRGQIIYHEGDEANKVHLIDEGMVGLFHIAENGKETFFRVFSENDLMGHRSLLAQEKYHASAVALSKVTLKTLSIEEFDKFLKENDRFNRYLLKLLAVDLGRAELRMSGLLDKTANKRIADSLVYLKLKYPDYVWTRREIAEYSGTTYESVTRLMTSLETKGHITKKGRDFHILEPAALLKMSEEDLSL